MLVFRSEAHVMKWLAGRQPGQSVSISTLAALAEAWWGDRLAPAWVPHPREHNQAILEGLGLTGPFWSLG